MRFEPYSQACAADPYPVYAYLRETTPVFHDPAFGMTFLTRHRDILDVLTDRRFGRTRPAKAPADARAMPRSAACRTTTATCAEIYLKPKAKHIGDCDGNLRRV